MRKAIMAAITALLIVAGVGVAQAERPADPGREHGMCTAFFNGQKKGHEKQKADPDKGEYPGPFEALVDDAPDGSDQNETGGDVADLYDWCQRYGIGGNPSENGRFTTCWTDDDGVNGPGQPQGEEVHNCDD